MAKIKEYKEVIVAIIISIIVICIANMAIGATSTAHYNFSDLTTSSNHLFCIQSGNSIKNSDGGVDYTVYGSTSSPYCSVWTQNSNQANGKGAARILAWILVMANQSSSDNYYGSDTGSTTAYQKALWYWIKTKSSSVTGTNLKNIFEDASGSKGVENDVYKAAVGKVNSNTTYTYYNSDDATLISGKKKIVRYTSSNHASGKGQDVKVKFKLASSASLKYVIVTWADGETYKMTGDSSGSSEYCRLCSDKSCSSFIAVDDISGKFFIRNKRESEIVSVEIKAKVPSDNIGYKVGIIWYKSKKTSKQDLIKTVVTAGHAPSETLTMTLDDIDIDYGSINVKKQGVYYNSKNQQQTENISIKFRIFCVDEEKYISGSATGDKTYVTSENDASVYETGTSGITISNLEADNKYVIEEVRHS